MLMDSSALEKTSQWFMPTLGSLGSQKGNIYVCKIVNHAQSLTQDCKIEFETENKKGI